MAESLQFSFFAVNPIAANIFEQTKKTERGKWHWNKNARCLTHITLPPISSLNLVHFSPLCDWVSGIFMTSGNSGGLEYGSIEAVSNSFPAPNNNALANRNELTLSSLPQKDLTNKSAQRCKTSAVAARRGAYEYCTRTPILAPPLPTFTTQSMVHVDIPGKWEPNCTCILSLLLLMFEGVSGDTSNRTTFHKTIFQTTNKFHLVAINCMVWPELTRVTVWHTYIHNWNSIQHVRSVTIEIALKKKMRLL